MKCNCGIETIVYKVLQDGTYTYLCRNPQCSEYNKVKTALGEEFPDMASNKTAIPCECSELLTYVTDTAYELPPKQYAGARFNNDTGKLVIECINCGKTAEFVTNGKEVKSI